MGTEFLDEVENYINEGALFQFPEWNYLFWDVIQVKIKNFGINQGFNSPKGIIFFGTELGDPVEKTAGTVSIPRRELSFLGLAEINARPLKRRDLFQFPEGNYLFWDPGATVGYIASKARFQFPEGNYLFWDVLRAAQQSMDVAAVSIPRRELSFLGLRPP